MPIYGLHLIFTYSARPRKRISLLFPAYLSTIFDKTAFYLSNVRFSLCRAGIPRFLVKPHNLSIKTMFCCFYTCINGKNTLYYRLCRSALCFRIWNDSSKPSCRKTKLGTTKQKNFTFLNQRCCVHYLEVNEIW